MKHDLKALLKQITFLLSCTKIVCYLHSNTLYMCITSTYTTDIHVYPLIKVSIFVFDEIYHKVLSYYQDYLSKTYFVFVCF